MARYKIILAYDGTEFSGSQRQAEARTVQGVLETALRKVGWRDPSIMLAGRTDSGVHASGQVAAFDLSWKHSADDLRHALNAVLPDDAAVRNVSEIGADFHPRFDATWRSYSYKILCDSTRHPLKERFVWRVWPEPALDKLQRAADELVGIHDFAAFGRPTSPEGSTVREVSQAIWHVEDGDYCRLTFEVKGNAFLYHMVRRMVNVQIAVGQGKLDPMVIAEALSRPESYPMFQGLAPPQGLILSNVLYE